ncbi:MAG: hypothetical protein U5L06_09960 [Rhodovibrio sp.]|nr:hypothetical protein [Rhodovibrio sp.]
MGARISPNAAATAAAPATNPAASGTALATSTLARRKAASRISATAGSDQISSRRDSDCAVLRLSTAITEGPERTASTAPCSASTARNAASIAASTFAWPLASNAARRLRASSTARSPSRPTQTPFRVRGPLSPRHSRATSNARSVGSRGMIRSTSGEPSPRSSLSSRSNARPSPSALNASAPSDGFRR